jgi:tRNA pseudouridine13 synthase
LITIAGKTARLSVFAAAGLEATATRMAIKQRPTDFIVDEGLHADYLAGVAPRPGPYALYRLHKLGLTTHEAIAAMARWLHCAESDIAAAGLKDKQASTSQHVTLRTESLHRPAPEQIEGRSFAAERIGFVAQAITSAAIRSNRFTIVARTLTRRAIDELRQAAARLSIHGQSRARGERLIVTNYYGNQRFGSARAGQGFIAAHLIRGEFEKALRIAIAVPHRKDMLRMKNFKQIVADHWESRDWRSALQDLPRVPERAAIEHLARKPTDFRGAFAALPYFFQQLTVEAYQSLLWNRIASTFLIDRFGDSGKLWIVDDQFGQLVFPEAPAIPPDLRDLDLPVLGRRTQTVDPWKNAAERTLAEEDLENAEMLHIRGLDRPWFAEVPRKLFMTVDDFEVGEPQVDEDQPKARRFKVTAKFTLPRGGYATVVLRALGQ